MYSIGDRIEGRYVVERVATGGVARVLIVRDEIAGAADVRFAVKTVAEPGPAPEEVLNRFRREARTWTGISAHPHVVSALDYREIEGRPYLFLEYIEGADLQSLLEVEGALPLAQVLDWGLQLCDAMAHAHRARVAEGRPGVVHRDLKPSNLFTTKDRVLKVTDFGMAKVFDRRLASTEEGVALGTPYYMPPEQLRDARSADERSDIYSAGVSLYELATGVIPLRARRIENQIYNILHAEPTPASTVRSGLPPELDSILARCLAKTRERRYPSFDELAVDLDRLLHAAEGGLELHDAVAQCSRCGLPSRRALDESLCSVCGGKRVNPGTYAILAAPPPATPRAPIVSEPAPSILSVSVGNRVSRTGRPVRVLISIINEGSEAAEAAVHFPVPGGFRVVGDVRSWRGAIPACDAERPLLVRYQILPTREGRFVLPPARVVWRDAEGRIRRTRGTAGPELEIEFSYRVPIVGREREARRFREALVEVSEGQPAMVVAGGPMGMGKTRLLEEFANAARAAGFAVIGGRSVVQSDRPMKALFEGLAEYFDVEPASLRPDRLVARIVDRLAPLVGPDADLARDLAAFLGGLGRGDPDESRSFPRWTRFFTELAEHQPVAILVDDLQWGHGETWEALAATLRQAREAHAPLMVVGGLLTSDPDPRWETTIQRLDDDLLDLQRSGVAVERLPLHAFDMPQLAEFVESVFPGNRFEADHPWFPRALLDHTGGNPYYVLEVMRTLREGDEDLRAVQRVDGVWKLDQALDEETFRRHVPRAVGEMVLRRLRGLPDEPRSVLATAALIGQEFETELLFAVEGNDASVEESLERLERSDVIRAIDDRRAVFRFRHSLVARSIARECERQAPEDAARRHRAIADAMRVRYEADGFTGRSVRFGRHLIAAGEFDEGVRMLVIGARRLVRQQAYPRAWSVLETLAPMLRSGETSLDPRTLADVLALRGEIAEATGRYAEGIECFQAMVRIGSGGVDAGRLATAYSRMGRIYEQRGEYEDARFSYGVSLGTSEDSGDEIGRLHALVDLGRVHFLEGRLELAEERFAEVGRRAGDVADPRLDVDLSIHIGRLRLAQGEPKPASRAFRAARDGARALGDRRLLAHAHNGLGNVAYNLGRLRSAGAHHRRALSLRRDIGDREGLSNSYNNLGVIQEALEKTERASFYFQRSAALHRELGSRHGLAAALHNFGDVQRVGGEISAAVESLEEAYRIRIAAGDHQRRASTAVALAEALVDAGDADRARGLLDEAIELSRIQNQPPDEARALVARARLAMNEGDRTGAAGWAVEARRALLNGVDRELDLARSMLDAELHLAEGRFDAAERGAREAEADARAIRSPSAVARARDLVARIRLASGDPAAAYRILRRLVVERGRRLPPPLRAELVFDLGRALAALDDARADDVLARAARRFSKLAARGRADREVIEIRTLRATVAGLRSARAPRSSDSRQPLD